MKDKYVVEIDSVTGLASICTTQIAAVFCHNSELTVHLVSSPSVVARFPTAKEAEAAYRKIAEALRAVA